MLERIDILIYRLRFVVVSLLIVASLLLLTCMLSASATAQDTNTSGLFVSNTYDSSNIVTASMAILVDGAVQTAQTAGDSMNRGAQTAATTTARGSRAVASGTARGSKQAVYVALAFTTLVDRAVFGSIAYVARLPLHTVDMVANAPVVRATLRPADAMRVPTIDPHAPALVAAKQPIPEQPPAPAVLAEAVWPVHGAITTLFGVPHWPYQPTHTGLDISDGRAPGTTSVRSFKPGRVIEAIRSNSGFGNHVVIDHGNGLTSLYGHLASISVQVGQMVDTTTILGLEGTTGASTGTHLHFEIQVNGQPVDPFQYVKGRP